MHPDVIVPAVPRIPRNKENDDIIFLDKLGKMLIVFLEQCLLSPSLRTDKMLLKFITLELPFSSILSTHREPERKPKTLEHIQTQDGQIIAQCSQEAEIFLAKAGVFFNHYQSLTK